MMNHLSDTRAINMSSSKDTHSLWLAKTLECYEVEEIDFCQLGRYAAPHRVIPVFEAATGTYDDW
jgi:hypothetical protein